MRGKKILVCCLSAVMLLSLFAGCGAETTNTAQAEEQVVIYSNADDEAITAMKNALDSNGYAGKYVMPVSYTHLDVYKRQVY